jgi:hypothetical protein
MSASDFTLRIGSSLILTRFVAKLQLLRRISKRPVRSFPTCGAVDPVDGFYDLGVIWH